MEVPLNHNTNYKISFGNGLKTCWPIFLRLVIVGRFTVNGVILRLFMGENKKITQFSQKHAIDFSFQTITSRQTQDTCFL